MPNHQLTAEGWEWSEGGRELLRAFKVEIQRSGGRQRVLAKVKRENNRRIYKFAVTDVPISTNSLIFNNWNKLTVPEISKLVNLPQGTVYWRGRWLGLPAKGTSLYQNNRKMVLNTETGIYYDSIILAAESNGLTLKYLSRKLKGKMRNNTSFIRL